MSTTPKSSTLLADQIALLVKHFGIQRVRAAVAKVTTDKEQRTNGVARESVPHTSKTIGAGGVSSVLESIRLLEPEKYRLLGEFLLSLRQRHLLPEAQDIRIFAQAIGLKEISGSKREVMVNKLMRFLVEQPIEKLRADIESAAGISERQRQMGYSVLADKLLGRP